MAVSIEIARDNQIQILVLVSFNLHRGIWVSGFGGSQCCCIFSGNSHSISLLSAGGLISFLYSRICIYVQCAVTCIYTHILGALHKFCIYIYHFSPSNGGTHVIYIYVLMFNVFYLYICKYFWSIPQILHLHTSSLSFHSYIYICFFMFKVFYIYTYMEIFLEHSTKSVFTCILSLLPTGKLIPSMPH